MEEYSNRNGFIALCDIAAKEKWCWKIYCSTCGHMYFRYAFLELTQGKHPDTPEWTTKHSNHNILHQCFGKLPSAGSWPVEQQKTLSLIFQHADISAIKSDSAFPDWLGYLGLALFYTSDIEQSNKEISKSWIPQLLDLLPPVSDTALSFRSILEKNMALKWYNMEQIEKSLKYH